MERALLADYLGQGLSQREIAAKEGCSQSTVRYWLSKHGLESGRPAEERPAPRLLPPPSLPSPPNAKEWDPSWLGSTVEAAVLAGLTSAGYPCFVPFGVSKADLVIETAEGLRTVQCKKAKLSRSGTVVSFRPYATARNGNRSPYAGIDYFGVACPEHSSDIYLVPVAEAGRRELSLRLSPAANGQQAGVRMAANYAVHRA